MKKHSTYHILTILCLFLSTINTNGQTMVSGFINNNTVWTAAGSPYIVTGNTIVSQNINLTIQPGVIIKFNTNKVLQIDGELIAIGSAASPIIFTSNQTIPNAGDWGKIQFSDLSQDAVFDANGNYLYGSILKFCDIRYAGSIGFGAVHLAYSIPYFNHCLITYSAESGIYSDHNTCKIDSSTIKHCNKYGIHIISNSPLTTSFELLSDTISYNQEGGLYIQQSFVFTYALIRNNTFIGNNGIGAISILPGIDSVIIENNNFTSNDSYTRNDGGTLFLQGNRKCIINCNKFINNRPGRNSTIGLNNNITKAGNYITNNIFRWNTSSLGSAVMDIYSTPAATLHNLFVINNYIEYNSSTTEPGINIRSTYFTDTTLVDHYFENNTIINNDSPNMFEFSVNGSNLNANDFIHLKNNNINNPLCNYEIYNNVPFGVSNIEADQNYWGTTNLQQINTAIYDFFDLGNLSVVYNTPILTNTAVTDTSCPIITTHAEEIQEPLNNWLLYPNPASTYIQLEKNTSNSGCYIEIFNTIGKLVRFPEFYSTNLLSIDIHDLPIGLYLLRILDRNNTESIRFMKN